MSLRPKQRECKGCGNIRYIFSKGRCAGCAALDRAKEKGKNPKPRPKQTRIPSSSAKGVAMKELDKKFYHEIWSEREHYCEECFELYGNSNPAMAHLGQFLKPFMFSHIMTKGAHPALRHVKLNINLLCFKHHQEWEFGKRSEMRIFENNQSIILELQKIENGEP
jgi:hypothetical protein